MVKSNWLYPSRNPKWNRLLSYRIRLGTPKFDDCAFTVAIPNEKAANKTAAI
jgi:hypothetical protein